MSGFVSVVATAILLASGEIGVGQWARWTEGDNANNHWYRLTDPVGPWADAKAQAEALGGYLVMVNDQHEENWL